MDEVHGVVYWSDDVDSMVRRAALDGSNQNDIYNVTKQYGCK